MRTVFRLGIYASVSLALVQAHARAPKTLNEQNLIYWRYLCENQPQVETNPEKKENTTELKCLSQGWSVKAVGDRVQEVVDHAR